MSFDYEEREAQLEDDGGPVLRTSRPSYREIPRSLEEVGFARQPTPPYVCRDRVGRWRHAHEFDERSLGEPCLWCGKRRPALRQASAA